MYLLYPMISPLGDTATDETIIHKLVKEIKILMKISYLENTRASEPGTAYKMTVRRSRLRRRGSHH